MRREYDKNPESLSDEQWLKLYAEYKFTEIQRYEWMYLAQKRALVEVVNAMFGDEGE
ncbi:MAG: hypothetical protein LBF19_07415 [Prevotellaceae bacterium]|nr:hypothetical protein [Prevotellaceae bacterium]